MSGQPCLSLVREMLHLILWFLSFHHSLNFSENCKWLNSGMATVWHTGYCFLLTCPGRHCQSITEFFSVGFEYVCPVEWKLRFTHSITVLLVHG